MADGPDWQRQQIAAAVPVADKTMAFRSDQLLDTDVRNPQDQGLGSVHDLVMDPKTGKIAYLIVARGGVFGFDRKYVPIPWDDFKMTQNASLLVLGATKEAMDGAPEVTDDQFTTTGHFDQENEKVDAVLENTSREPQIWRLISIDGTSHITGAVNVVDGIGDQGLRDPGERWEDRYGRRLSV